MPRSEPKKAQKPEKLAIGAAPRVDQPRSIANTPSRTAPTTVGSRMMRPAASQAARPEPTAIEIEKMARQVVTTSSSPPSTFFTSGGISESATAPTSQNQLVTMRAPQQPADPRAGIEQADGGGEDVLLHHEVGRRLVRCAG